jgi:hypothetical protein
LEARETLEAGTEKAKFHTVTLHHLCSSISLLCRQLLHNLLFEVSFSSSAWLTEPAAALVESVQLRPALRWRHAAWHQT